jgi:predicted O-methyltransferase YrrM
MCWLISDGPSRQADACLPLLGGAGLCRMRTVARAVLKLEARLLRGHAIPLSLVTFARRLAVGEDPLLPRPKSITTTGRALRHPDLRALLADHELGTWALGARTVNWLEHRLAHLRPSLVLEFGSGASTLCIARFLVDLHGQEAMVRVVSIDQDESYARQTRELLRRSGLDAYAKVVSASLKKQEIEGVLTRCYDIPANLSEVLQGHKADFVVIDGPAAEAGARFGTLPLARPYLSPSAAFVMDDGLRDGEIWIAHQWATLPGVRVDGIVNIDKGLVVGQVTGG